MINNVQMTSSANNSSKQQAKSDDPKVLVKGNLSSTTFSGKQDPTTPA